MKDYLTYVAKRSARLMNLKGVPIMKIQNRRRGRAHTRDGYFTIPLWATKKHQAYAVAYVIHELAHFAKSPYSTRRNDWYTRFHGPTMRRIEAETAERFGLRLAWNGKAYIDRVLHLDSGRPLCGKHGDPWMETEQYSHPACLI